MQALNFAHLDFSIIGGGGVGTVLSTERSKGIRVGFAELQLEAFFNLRGLHTLFCL